MSAVEKLRPAEAVKDAPALGFSIQVDLGSGRVATLQTFLPNDCGQGELDAMLDKMTRAGDRQRAHYKIEELERDLAQEEKLQAQHQEDLAKIDADYDTAQARRYADAEREQAAINSYLNAARDAHVATGRRGQFEPKGPEAQRKKVLETSIDKIKGEIAAATAEHNVAHANSASTFKRRGEVIAKTKAEIAACRALVDGNSTA